MSHLTLSPPPTADDDELLAALKAGDERAFAVLVDRHSRLMLRVAQTYVRTESVAEEVVQETWAIVYATIGRFERRAALKTWIMRILTNRAKTRGEREARCTPFSALPTGEPDATDGPWAPGCRCADQPEDRLLNHEVRGRIRDALDQLPVRQQTVVALRDVEGWSPEEVCDALGVSEGNQRVLLHRARSRMRTELESYLGAAA